MLVRNRPVSAALGFGLLILTSLARAQELPRASEEPAAESEPVEQVVVPAGKDESQVTSPVASFAVSRLKITPAVITVLTTEEIRRSGARDLLDLLYQVPGFFPVLGQRGVVGPGFRGLSGLEGRVILLVDGKEMNDLLYAGVQLGNEFPMELVERVEVVRGPGSVVYGSNAELAVINVVTRGLQGPDEATVSGTYGQMPAGASLQGGYARRALSASGRCVIDSVPGLTLYLAGALGQGQRSVTPLSTASGTGAMQGNSALNPAIVQAGLGYRNLQASLLFHRLGTSTVAGGADSLTALSRSAFDSLHAEVFGTWRPTDRVEIVPRLSFTYQRPWNTPDPASPYFYDKSASRARVRLFSRWAPVNDLQLTVGADAMFDHGSSPQPWNTGFETPFQAPSGGSVSVDDSIAAGFMEFYSENPVVNVVAGVRYERHSTAGGAMIPRLTLHRSFGPLQFKALLGLAFRRPALENLASSPALQQEQSTTYEVEGSWELTPRQRLSFDFFDIRIGSPIAYASAVDPSTGERMEVYQNLGRIGTRGVEATYRFRAEAATASVNYSFYGASIAERAESVQVPGQSSVFLAAPAHRFTLNASFKPKPWLSIHPTLLVLGPRYGLNPSTQSDGSVLEQGLKLPWQCLANLAVRVEDLPIKGLDITLGLFNLFGANYRFLAASAGSSAPMPGLDREIMLRVGYTARPSKGT
jgi:outer membrane receptor protein involved in Fe transport